jgi:Cu-Zn family superoxide dismutase
MKHRPLIPASTAVLSALVLFLTGCAASGSNDMSGARVALVTASGAPAGNATLRELPGGAGVEIAIQVQDMTPGPHGFHIHTNGACAPGPDPAGQTIAFGATGGHFDPFMTGKHGRPGQSAHEAHAGEAPNILVGADRQGSLRFTNPHLTLQPGKTSVMGRALVVHEREDDYATNPAGNSGGRIACGVITPAAAGRG